MTSRRFEPRFLQALSNYITHLLTNFEMTEWQVKIDDEYPDGKDIGASISPVYGRKVATMRLCEDFFDFDKTDQSHYIIHELCHLISEGVDTIVQNGPETLMGKPAYTMFFEAYRAQLEYMTDHLATLIRFYATGGEIHDKLLDELMASEKPIQPEEQKDDNASSERRETIVGDGAGSTGAEQGEGMVRPGP
jgi:hypothetical protein